MASTDCTRRSIVAVGNMKEAGEQFPASFHKLCDWLNPVGSGDGHKDSSMPYFIRQRIMAPSLRLELTDHEFKRITLSASAVLATVKIEEEWDILVQNFIELEMEMLSSAMNSMVVGAINYHAFQDTRLKFARRLGNLLSSCRSYLDHAPHNLGELSEVDLATAFKGFANEAYDAHFGYRLMGAAELFSASRPASPRHIHRRNVG